MVLFIISQLVYGILQCILYKVGRCGAHYVYIFIETSNGHHQRISMTNVIQFIMVIQFYMTVRFYVSYTNDGCISTMISMPHH